MFGLCRFRLGFGFTWGICFFGDRFGGGKFVPMFQKRLTLLIELEHVKFVKSEFSKLLFYIYIYIYIII